MAAANSSLFTLHSSLERSSGRFYIGLMPVTNLKCPLQRAPALSDLKERFKCVHLTAFFGSVSAWIFPYSHYKITNNYSIIQIF